MAAARSDEWNDVDQIGLYSIPVAARLIGAGQTKLRSWICGYPNSEADPIIHRQLPQIGNRTAIGFLDLIDARFVRHFTTWFSPQTIRRVAIKLREMHGVDHPFATRKRFRTDGRAIFMDFAEDEQERKILNLMNDNFEMGEIIEPSLFDLIFYVDDVAAKWTPNPDTPAVIVDPKVSFGRPVLADHWVPTEVLHDAYLIEGSMDAVSDDFEIGLEGVRQAVRFEQLLDRRLIH